MSRYIKAKTFTFNFDGDAVQARLSPLEYPDMMRLQSQGQAETRIADFVAAAREITPRYVTEFTGLKDAEGNVLGYDVVTSQVYFAELLREIVSKLLELSQPVTSDPT